MPTKWLQERAKGSKNEHGMPPRRAFCGGVDREEESLAKHEEHDVEHQDGAPEALFRGSGFRFRVQGQGSGSGFRVSGPAHPQQSLLRRERKFFIDNLLVQILFIV
jgi:hypothetical protein